MNVIIVVLFVYMVLALLALFSFVIVIGCEMTYRTIRDLIRGTF